MKYLKDEVPATWEKYPNWDGEPFSGIKDSDFTLVGFQYHCTDREFEEIEVGDMLFLRREPDNPVDTNAIVALRGIKPVGYVQRADIPLLDNLVPEEDCIACYVEEKYASSVSVRVPSIFSQKMDFIQKVLESIPKDVDMSKCPTINFCIGADIVTTILNEVKEAETEMKNSENGLCAYMMVPNILKGTVALSRSFTPNSYYFCYDSELVEDYIAKTGVGAVAFLKEIDKKTLKHQNAIAFKFSCVLYREYDQSIKSKHNFQRKM